MRQSAIAGAAGHKAFDRPFGER